MASVTQVPNNTDSNRRACVLTTCSESLHQMDPGPKFTDIVFKINRRICDQIIREQKL